MKDKNEVAFSGTIERLKSINTKTGTSMATLLLKVGEDRFKVVAFKNVADAILECSDGDHIGVTGSGSINGWKDKDDRWHNDFQLSAWEVEIHGEKINYEKRKFGNGNNSQPTPPQDEDQFGYQGGPF